VTAARHAIAETHLTVYIRLTLLLLLLLKVVQLLQYVLLLLQRQDTGRTRLPCCVPVHDMLLQGQEVGRIRLPCCVPVYVPVYSIQKGVIAVESSLWTCTTKRRLH